MIKFEKPEVWGWEHAIRGMRNPLNSWERSDSYPAVDCGKCGNDETHVEGAAKATNKTVVSSRFDSTGFKKEYPELFTEYSRETSYKRFCVL